MRFLKEAVMVIVTSVSFPTESSKELGKRFLEAPAFPDFITRKGPYFSSNKKDGIMVFSIYEVDRSRVADAIEFATNFLATFIGVPGFKYEIKTHLETAEALKMIGMA
jgi:hypothetical protein